MNIFRTFDVAERRAFDRAWSYITRHVHEIVVFVVFSVILMGLTRLPYINIAVGSYVVQFVLFAAFVFLFRVPLRVVIGFTVLLFSVLLYYLLIRDEGVAENIGNLLYFLLWFDVCLYIRDIKHRA